MNPRIGVALALALALPLLLGRAPSARAEDEYPAALELTEAYKRARDILDKTRRLPQRSRDAKDAIKSVKELLEPHAEAVRERYARDPKEARKACEYFAVQWNRAVSIAAYHGVKLKGSYIAWKETVAFARLIVDFPVASNWKVEWAGRDSKQLHGTFIQMRPDGTALRKIKVWRYRWDTVYSGVGGENYKKLAAVIHEIDEADEDRMPGTKVSPLKVKKLNREFARAYHWKVDVENGDGEVALRTTNWYFKGRSATFCFEVIEHFLTESDDDEMTVWMLNEKPIELEAFLASIVRNEDR